MARVNRMRFRVISEGHPRGHFTFSAGTSTITPFFVLLLFLAIGRLLRPLPADAACAQSVFAVMVRTMVVGAKVPVVWSIAPPCDVIETGLLMGADPATLAPVGQPIYGYRAAYQQEIPVAESGQYWLAAYVRDEAGATVQSQPRLVVVAVPPAPFVLPGSHGAPPTYSGTDADFLQQAGNPHFASLRSTMLTAETVTTLLPPFPSLIFIDGNRHVSSTHREEIRATLDAGISAGGITFPVDPVAVNQALDQMEAIFNSRNFPRPGLYSLMCQVAAMGQPPPPRVATCRNNVADQIGVEYREASSVGAFSRLVSSVRSSFTYFIPGTPPNQQLVSARLSVRVFTTGDFSAIRLSGKPPVSLVPVGSCSPEFCSADATWDFTDEARSLAAQGGGELHLMLDPISPAVIQSPDPVTSTASFAFALGISYPWRHVGPVLTLIFEAACPKGLTLSVTPGSVRPRLPTFQTQWPAGVATSGDIEALVKSCPVQPESLPTSVTVNFVVRVPEEGSEAAGGHAHNSMRPTGTFQMPYNQGGQTTASCTVTSFDADGMGTCTVKYHPHQVSGVETIIANATGFPNATATVTVEVPGLVNLADVQTNFFRLTGKTTKHPDNHWGSSHTIESIQLVAFDFFERFQATLGINDASLRQGGLFDIKGDWKPLERDEEQKRLKQGHLAHRKGRSVDIDRTACVDPNVLGTCSTTINVPKDYIGERCGLRGQGVLAEEDNIHCEFPR